MRPLSQLALAAALGLLSCALASGETSGQAEMAFQGYYAGGTGQPVDDTTGMAIQFRQFLPNFGLLSGSLEDYGHQGRFAAGDNFLELRGLTWGGLRWTFTGGDFRTRSSLVDFPFYNVFLPDILARGFKLEASHGGRQYTLFFGNETLAQGPYVPFRLKVPQSVVGASVQQKFGTRLQLGARLMRFSTDTAALEQNPFFFPLNRQFLDVSSLQLQSLFSINAHLRAYAESGLTVSEQAENLGPYRTPLSTLVGSVWDSQALTLRANYTYQGTSYLPVLGYFLGDRRGPFGEAILRPFRRLDLFGSANHYTNNLEQNPNVPTFRTTGNTAGLTVRLPWKLNATTQLSTVRFASTSSDPRENVTSDDRQLMATLTRPIRRHTLLFSVRDMKLASNLSPQRERTAEAGDTFQFRRFALGGAARAQRMIGNPERRNTLFFRGFAQAQLSRLSGHVEIETGNDLVNRTVFATNTFSTTTFGISARLTREWNLQVEAFRNRLLTDLNPESAFLLGGRGLGISTILAGLNHWNVYFRLSKQLHWGKALPAAASNIDQYVVQQIPLVGSVEGFVFEQRIGGKRPAEGVPVSLDQSKTATTDASGRFCFPEVPEGPHTIGLAIRELPADYDPGDSRQNAVLVKSKHVTRSEDLSVIGLTFLEGTVAVPAGIPTENIVIRLLPGTRYTTADSDGRFSFQNLREGDYQVELDEKSVPEGSRLESPARLPVTVRLGADHAAIHFQLGAVEKKERPVRKVFER